ncbi:MAG: single-stranded DNA-binding protein [Erysipelotrichaceae bacterium]|nr:single-stranded DNA-binding protein [Erysipelotrichaceae bacterium]
MNEFKIIGKAVSKPDLSESDKGYKYCSLVLDVKRNYRKEDEDAPVDTYKVVCFNTLAEEATRNIEQGSDVVVIGRLQSNNTEKENGTVFYRPELIADKVYCVYA